MLAHITAVKALLAPLGYAVYYVDVPEAPAFPYVLLWGTGGIAGPEQPMSGPADLTDRLGVTCVAGTPEGVLIAAARVRGVLDGAEPAVAGRRVWLSLWDSRAVQVDREVTIPNTNRHPAYGVDLYALTSVPV